MKTNAKLKKKIFTRTNNKKLLITGENSNKKTEYKTLDLDSLNINNSNSDITIKEKKNINNNLKIKLNPYLTQTNFKLIKQKILNPTHTIFNRFQKEFNKNFNKSINETKLNFSLSILKNKPELFPISERKKIKKIQIKKYLKKNILNENDLEEENEESLNLSNEKIEKTISNSSKKTITFSQPSNILNYNNNYKRKRDFKEYNNEKYIKNQKWKNKLGINSEYKFNSFLENDLKFQSNIIKDELTIILDNIQYFKTKCLSNKKMLSSFKNKELSYQIHINKILEETSFLLNKIPKIILKEYYDYNERFIAIEGAKYEDFKSSLVNDESEIFIVNSKLLNKIGNFLKCCFDVYVDLVSQISDNMIIEKSKFNLLLCLCEKIRFLIGELTISCNNIIKDLEFDINLIDKYKSLIVKNDSNLFRNKNFKHISIEEKMKKDLQFKKNDISQKINRINNSLLSHRKQKESLFEIKGLNKKTKIGPMGIINSNIMTKMLKYIDKDVRGKIISLRSIDRIQKNSENN